MSPRSDHLKGLAITTAGVLVLTPDSLLIRLIETDTWTLLFWRGVLSFAGLFAIALVRYGGETRARFAAVGAMGMWAALAFTGSSLFFVTAIKTTAVANALVIVSATPLFAALFSRVFLKEPVPARTWVAMVIGIAAIGYIVGAEASGGFQNGSMLGNLAAVGCAACMGMALTLMRKARGDNALQVVTLAGIMMAIVALAPSTPLSIRAEDIGYLVVLCLVVVPGAFVMTTIGPRYLPAPEVGLIFLLETVLGPFWVWLVLSEQPPEAAFIGGGVLIATLVVHAWLGLRASRPSA